MKKSNYYLGYLWLYKEDFQQGEKPKGTEIYRRISQFDLGGNLIKVFSTIKEAKEELGCSYAAISKCLNGSNKSIKGTMITYEDIGIVPKPYKRDSRISKEKMEKVKQLLSENLPILQIANIVGSTRKTIRDIKNGLYE